MKTKKDTTKPETTLKQDAGEGPEATCSGIMLAKRCPDGRIANLQFADEGELQDHLIAMWQITGYEIVAIFRVPNAKSIHPDKKPNDHE